MAKYRSIQTSFWVDPFVQELTPEQKFFYLYLITNPCVTQCGIYEITLRTIEFDTGYNKETIEKLIAFFEGKNKIKYSKESNEICVINFLKHNSTSSPKMAKCISTELEKVKNRVLIGYVYGMDTGQNLDGEKEKEKEKEKEYINSDSDTFSSKSQIQANIIEDVTKEIPVEHWRTFSKEEKMRRVNAIVQEVYNSSEIMESVARMLGIKNLQSQNLRDHVKGFIDLQVTADSLNRDLYQVRTHLANYTNKVAS